MLVLNHCGVSNAVYQTSFAPVPYSSIPSHEHGNLVVDFTPGEIDLRGALEDAEVRVVDHPRLRPRERRGKHFATFEFDETRDKVAISHVVTIADDWAAQVPIFFDAMCRFRNWVLVYHPPTLYGPGTEWFSDKQPLWARPGAYHEGLEGFRGGDHRSSSGPTPWRLYFACTHCGAYTSHPGIRKYQLTGEEPINGASAVHVVPSPWGKCDSCTGYVFHDSRACVATRLGELNSFIFCRFDRITRFYVLRFDRTLT